MVRIDEQGAIEMVDLMLQANRQQTVSLQFNGFALYRGGVRLQLLAVQPAGKGVLSGSDFARGYRPQVGEVLG